MAGREGRRITPRGQGYAGLGVGGRRHGQTLDGVPAEEPDIPITAAELGVESGQPTSTSRFKACRR